MESTLCAGARPPEFQRSASDLGEGDMKKRFSALTLTLIAFATCGFAQQQEEDQWAKYVPGKLIDVIKANTSRNMQHEQGVDIAVGSAPVKARVAYSGKSRRIPDDKRSLIKLWMQSNKYSEETFQMFTEEFLFTEDGVEYWLPVQSVLIPHFKKEMREGEPLDLFAVWIGITFAEPGKRQHVFLVNEFEKVKENAPRKPPTHP